MKNSKRLYRWVLCLALVCALVVSGVPFVTAAPADVNELGANEIFLTDLPAESGRSNEFDVPVIGSAAIGSVNYDHSITMHPGPVYTAFTHYDISGLGYTKLTADAANINTGDVTMYVYGDGKELFKAVSGGKDVISHIDVDITGVHDLCLTVDNNADYSCDLTAFGNPRLTAGTKKDAGEGEIGLTALRYNAKNCTATVNSGTDSHYSMLGGEKQKCSGFADKNIDGFSFNDSVMLVPAGGTDGYAEYDISTINATRFGTYVGLDSNLAGAPFTDKACFEVWVNYGITYVKLASSPLMSYGEYYYLSCDVTGAKKLKLVVNDGGDGTDGDYCVFGSPKLFYKLANAAKTVLYASDVAMRGYKTNGEIGFDKEPDEGRKIKVGGTEYNKGIFCHPILELYAGGAIDRYMDSILYFDVAKIRASRFTAKVGQCLYGNATGGDGVIFRVYGDGKCVAESPVLTGQTATYDFDVDVSEYSFISLRVNPNGDYAGDSAAWADARFTFDGTRAAENKFVKTTDVTKLQWTELQTNGTDHPSVETMTMGGLEFDRVLNVHPMPTESSFIKYNIAGLGYNRFSSYISKCDKYVPRDTAGSTYYVEFIVYGDGKELYHSDKVDYLECGYISVDVTGVSELTLELSMSDDFYNCDSSGWVNPTLYTNTERYGIGLNDCGWDMSRVKISSDTTFTGFSRSAGGFQILVNGEEVNAPISMDGFGNFSFSYSDYKQTESTVTLNTISAGETVFTKEFGVKVAVDDIYSLSDLSYIATSTVYRNQNHMGYPLTAGAFKAQSEKGLCVPYSGGNIDINYDISGSDFGYVQTLVGKDDYSSTTATSKFYLIVDGAIKAESPNMAPGMLEQLSCDIPNGASKLTLRVMCTEGAGGNNSDWINPMLCRSKAALGSHDVSAYSESADNRNLAPSYRFAARFSALTPFDNVKLTADMNAPTAEVKLYRYTSSLERSIQNIPIYSNDAMTLSDEGQFVVNPGMTLSAGEYILVVYDSISVRCCESSLGMVYDDEICTNAFPNMSVGFTKVADEYYGTMTAEKNVHNANEGFTAAENQRAKDTLEKYMNDLSKLPSQITIGDTVYNGFGSDFTETGRVTTTNEKKHQENTVITMHHNASGIDFDIHFALYPEYASFEWTIYFTNNTSNDSVNVKNVNAANITFKGNDPYIGTSTGDIHNNLSTPYTAKDMFLEKDKDYYFSANKSGRSTETAFPYFDFEYGNSGVLMAVGWPGNWQTNFNYNGTSTTVTSGLKSFDSYLKPGETARSPLVTFTFYDGRNLDRSRNLWRSWFIDCNMSRNGDDELLEPSVGGCGSQYFSEMENATTDNQIQCIRLFKDKGVDIDYWWMDAGWYVTDPANPAVTGSWGTVGLWTVSSRLDFGAISNYAHEKGVNTLLWFEPERFAVSPDLLKEDGSTVKAEWLTDYGTIYYDGASQHMINLGADGACEWMTERVLSILKSGGMSLYREDYNIEPNGYWNAGDTEGRKGITENSSVQGHLKFWDNIVEAGYFIDSCASGGGRNDLENLRRGVTLHVTDALYSDWEAKQGGTMTMFRWWGYIGSNTGYNQDNRSDVYALRSSLRSWSNIQYDPRNSNVNFSMLSSFCDDFHSFNRYNYDNYYELTEWSSGSADWASYEFLDTDAGNGSVMVFRRGSNQVDTKTIRLKGLENNANYSVSFNDAGGTVSGTGYELMTTGIEVSLTARSSEILYITKNSSGAVEKGDVNMDNAVTAVDALAVLRHAVRIEYLTGRSQQAADLYPDNRINIQDALLVLQAAVGK